MLSPPAALTAPGRAFARLKAGLQAERTELREKFQKTADGAWVLREHRRMVDRYLKNMWSRLRLPASVALLAVGGYGRGEFYPHSDIDVLVLLPEAPSAGLAAMIEELVGRLWDTGLELRHSGRTVAECVEKGTKDVTVMTSLPEGRLLAGNRGLLPPFEPTRRECPERQVFFTDN